jgi:hypothetical protein
MAINYNSFKENYDYFINYINSKIGIRGSRLLISMITLIVMAYVYFIYFASMDMDKHLTIFNIPGRYVYGTYVTIFFIGTLYLIAAINALPISEENINFEPSQTSQVVKMGIVLFLFGLFFFILYSIFNNSPFFNFETLWKLFVILFGLTLIYSIYKDVFKKGGLIVSDADDSYISIIKNLIFYIPCLIVDFIELIQKEYNLTPNTTYYILAIETIIVLLYFFGEFLGNTLLSFVTHTSKVLVDEPLSLNKKHAIGTYPIINPKKTYETDDNEQDYSYGLSSWIYINPQYGYDQYKTLLNYGGKPLIEYKGQTNTLRIKIKSGIDTENIVYESNDFKLQKWNNFVINVYENTIDIHLNNELILSEGYDVSTWNLHQSIVVGDNNGLEGGITNVRYFNHPISKPTITFSYLIFKDKNIPIV